VRIDIYEDVFMGCHFLVSVTQWQPSEFLFFCKPDDFFYCLVGTFCYFSLMKCLWIKENLFLLLQGIAKFKTAVQHVQGSILSGEASRIIYFPKLNLLGFINVIT
jgi:hypothetical protein